MPRAYWLALLLLSSCDASLFGQFRISKSDCEQSGLVCPSGTSCGTSATGTPACLPPPSCGGLDVSTVRPERFLRYMGGLATVSVANLPPEQPGSPVTVLVGDVMALKVTRLSTTDVQFEAPPQTSGQGKLTVPIKVLASDGRCGSPASGITYFPTRFEPAPEMALVPGTTTAIAVPPVTSQPPMVAVATKSASGELGIGLWTRQPSGALEMAPNPVSVIPSVVGPEIVALGFGDIDGRAPADLVALLRADDQPLRTYMGVVPGAVTTERKTTATAPGRRTAIAIGPFDGQPGDEVIEGVVSTTMPGSAPVLLMAKWEEASSSFRETQINTGGTLPVGDITRISIGDFSGDNMPDLAITIAGANDSQQLLVLKQVGVSNDVFKVLVTPASSGTQLPILVNQTGLPNAELLAISSTAVRTANYESLPPFDLDQALSQPLMIGQLVAATVLNIDRGSPIDLAVLGKTLPVGGTAGPLTGELALLRGGVPLLPFDRDRIPFPVGLTGRDLASGDLNGDSLADLVILVDDPTRSRLWVLINNGID